MSFVQLRINTKILLQHTMKLWKQKMNKKFLKGQFLNQAKSLQPQGRKLTKKTLWKKLLQRKRIWVLKVVLAKRILNSRFKVVLKLWEDQNKELTLLFQHSLLIKFLTCNWKSNHLHTYKIKNHWHINQKKCFSQLPSLKRWLKIENLKINFLKSSQDSCQARQEMLQFLWWHKSKAPSTAILLWMIL